MTNLKQLFLIGTCLSLVSCGGGGSSAPVTTVAPPPAVPPPSSSSQSSTVFGPIAGFGSIIVNGVRYDTSSASFTVDDASGTQADLKVGQIVTIKATTDAQGNASAQQVIFDDAVQGPIDSIDVANDRLVVLGQIVLISGTTSFDDRISPANLSGLTVGDIVEVSGEFNGDGDIVASRIEPKPAGTEFEVHGTVAGLDTSAQTFTLKALTVAYGTAVLDDFGAGGIAAGDFVEVKGSTFNTGGQLIARKVELEGMDGRIGDNNDSGEIHGFVADFNSATDFTVSGVPVTTTNSTEYIFGSAGDLATNVRVEVEGRFNGDGVLVADKVKFETEANVRITADLDSVDATNQTITIFGVNFSTDASTRLEDKSDAEISPFNLSNLNAGDYLEVRGFDRASDGLYASRIEREDPDNENEVQAFVDSVGTDSLIILGITINTDSNTQFQDLDDSVLTRAEFFNLVRSGSLVKADGTKTGTSSLLAEELSFENPDD